MENFTCPRPTPTGIHSAAQPVGPRVPKAGARVVFRTEPFSDVPPFRGGLHRLPDPVRREGRAATRPTGGKARRWAPFMFREHVFSQLLGTARQSLKMCTHGYGMCQFRPVISSAGPQSNAPYRPRIVHHRCEISQSRPASKVWTHSLPLPLPPTVRMNRGICDRSVSEVSCHHPGSRTWPSSD